MKRIFVSSSLLIALIFLASSGATAFVEKRHQWWEVRLKNLEAEKTRLQQKSALDPQVIGLIEKEMNRARDIIAVFESEMRDDGSLTHVARPITGEEIDAEARKIVPPLFALHYLEALANETGRGPVAVSFRNVVKGRLNTLIHSSFGKHSPDLTRRIMEKDITGDEWKALAVEHFIGSMMASRKAMEDHAIADITSRVSLALKEKNNIVNTRELRLMTVKAADEYLAGCNAREVTGNGAALDASWTWRRIESNLARDFGACRKIIALVQYPAGSRGSLSLERIMYYHRNPADLDAMLFKGQRPQQPARASSAQSPERHPANAVIMEIPSPLNMTSILDDIDRMRRGAIAAISGREDDNYFNRFSKNLATIISRRSSMVKNHFFREEERVRLLRRKEGETLPVANDKEFRDAKKRFQDDLSLLDGYGKRSMKCIAIISEGKKINSGAIVEQYRYRLRRDEDYLRFVADLVSECSRLSSFEDPRVHKRFSHSLSRIGTFFNFITDGLSLERNDRTHLTKQDLRAIRDLRSGFAGTMGSIRSDIGSCRSTYGIKRSSAAVAAQKGREHLKETIAQDEIDRLFRHAVESVELFEQYQYGEKTLYRYADRYKSFMKEARTGAPSESLEYSLKMSSLLASLEGFDDARVARELATKQYLQKEAKASLARLAVLLDFYKKNNVTFKDAPRSGELASLEKRVSIMPLVKIDSWVMNEGNYREVDKKAARKLSLIVRRRDLTSVNSRTVDGKSRVQPLTTVSLKEPELSLTLPRGWAEDTIGEAETYLGVVKSFHNGDGSSSVQLVKLALDRGGMKEAAEGWIEKSGCSLVEKRWDKAGDIDCLRILARDRQKNIFETYSFSKDGFAILISGRTSRDRYAVFKIQFKKIINSLQMDIL